MKALVTAFLSTEAITNEEIPERCTEKLVDLVFVLATKLDLNVNDMRELLDGSVKETGARFEVVTTKMTDNFQSLTEQLERLRDNGVNDISQYAEFQNLLQKVVW